MRLHQSTLLVIALASASPAATLPSECETAGSLPDRLYSYFGGVGSFSVSQSATPCYDGMSAALTIGFQPSIFNVAGVGIGSLGISDPDLAVPSNADTFSITIKSPETGQLAFFVTIQEDDDANGIIDITAGDDEWESPVVMLLPGTNSYNIPVSAFFDNGQGSGNGVNNFTTTPRLAFQIDIHSRSTFPGGLVTTPKSLYLDHIGLYVGNQTPPPPPPACPGDADGNLLVEFPDITSVLANWGFNYAPGTGLGDADANGLVEFGDITSVLTNFGAACP